MELIECCNAKLKTQLIQTASCVVPARATYSASAVEPAVKLFLFDSQRTAPHEIKNTKTLVAFRLKEQPLNSVSDYTTGLGLKHEAPSNVIPVEELPLM